MLTDRPSWSLILMDFVFLFAVIAEYQNELGITIFMGLLFIVSVDEFAKGQLRQVIVFTVAFPMVEIICILCGVWTYSVTSILVIPIWLFFAWGQATVTIIFLSKRVDYIRGKRL